VRYPTILFDLDGTLIDSVELILASYRHTLRVHRGDTPPDSVWLAGLGTPLRVQFRSFTDDPAEIEAMTATYRDWNLAHHDEMVTAYPGAVDTVRALHAAGARLGIVTSKSLAGLHRGLDLCGLTGMFEALVTSDELSIPPKPDPAPVRLALAQLQATPGQTLFVGDSPHDIAAGRDAGTETAACLWGPFDKDRLAEERPTHWLHSYTDLATLTGLRTDD